MAHNPLDDADPEHVERVRRRAYQLWEEDGRPDGRSEEFWERARELVGMTESGNYAQLPNPASEPDADPMHLEVVEEASIQENLGEFPDRLRDQGEISPTPKAKRRRTTRKE